eukprot:15328355-Ditylum_brightwellii.AAC.1
MMRSGRLRILWHSGSSERGSIQLLKYKPTNYLYRGYRNMCVRVVQNISKRKHRHHKKDDDKYKINVDKNEKGKAHKAQIRNIVW